jgi:hypothetical protein
VQKSEPRTCLKAPVQIAAGNDSAAVSLLRCDGTPTPLAVAQLSILARPGSAAKPTKPVEALAKTAGADVAPGIRRVDARLLERLEIVADHFRKTGQDLKVQLISGVRPKSVGSYHQTGRALDFRIDGVTNEALVAFCKTLNDTGCGYYPNSLFVHMDVREKGAGHVSWIDISRPGETPKYVSQWPLPKDGPKTPDDPASPADGPNAPSMPAAAISLPTLPMDEPTDGHGSRRRRDGKTYIF